LPVPVSPMRSTAEGSAPQRLICSRNLRTDAAAPGTASSETAGASLANRSGPHSYTDSTSPMRSTSPSRSTIGSPPSLRPLTREPLRLPRSRTTWQPAVASKPTATCCRDTVESPSRTPPSSGRRPRMISLAAKGRLVARPLGQTMLRRASCVRAPPG
jgi:hypothetical protein